MNRIILLLTIFSLGTLSMSAQVSEQMATMSQGSNNALGMQLANVDVKTAEKVWNKYLKNYKGKPKKVKKSEDWLADDIDIPAISTNTIDLYSQFDENGDGVFVRVWIDLGGAYLSSSSHADKYSEAIRFMDGFALAVEIEAVNQRLKAEEAALKNFEKDLEGLQKDQKQEEENIARYEQKIKDSEALIQESIQNQGLKASEIESQKATIEATKAELKDLERMN